MIGIERDKDRFHQISRGKIKTRLKDFISKDKIIGKRGSDKIAIPIPKITIPRFTYGQQQGGVGQGSGQGEAGKDGPDDNPLEIEVSLDEMAELLGEELELPNIKPKGKGEIVINADKYTTIRRKGPEALHTFRRTFREALKRQIAAGEYDPKNPKILPIPDDKRYKASKPITIPENKAVIFYIMDVSGSMGENQKELARLTSFWIDLWLRSQYKNIQSRYVIHHHLAKEVDQDTFYRTSEGGGTRIASAYEKVRDILKVEYNVSDWNIYMFQYSDGEDWAGSTSEALDIIGELLEISNQIAYCQVRNGGNFMNDLKSRFGEDSRLVTAFAEERDQILDAIKLFFAKGH